MINSNSPTSSPTANEARDVYRAALIMLGLAGVSLLVELFFYFQLAEHPGQILWTIGSLALLGGLCGLSAGLSRRGRATLGAWLVLGGIQLAMLVHAALLSGVGLPLGVANLLLTLAIATQVITVQRWVNWAMIMGIVVDLGAGTLQVAPVAVQLSAPQALQVSIWGLAFAGVVIAGVFVILRFRSYSVANKLIIVFLAATLGAGLLASLITALLTRSLLGPELADRVAQQAALANIFGLLLAGLAAVFIGRFIALPIVQLTEVARRVTAGDLTARAAETSSDETGVLAAAFNAMTDQLQLTMEKLELYVVERTRALEISAQVSRRLSTLMDQNQIVTEVVEQLRSAYNYYHVHIYLYDELHDNLIMVGGTGEAGKIMLARKHHLSKGKGLVGRAAETNTVVLVPDVAQAAGWVSNPLLPDTKAEVAVPIALGDLVLGVLDVQHNIQGGLRQSDADLIQSVASQVAIALRNARTYAQAQREADTEALISTISRKIQNTTTMSEAMQTTIRELGRALKAQSAAVKLHPFLVKVSGEHPEDSKGEQHA